MQRLSLARRPCTIARALDQLGDAWSLLVLRDIFLGAYRFADLQERLGIASNILTRRLEALTHFGLLRGRVYSVRPRRLEYTLTEKGAEVLPVLLVLSAWGGKWLAPRGAPLLLIDPESGAELDPVVVDRTTGLPLAPNRVAVKPGPGAPKSLRRELRTPRVFSAPAHAEAA